MSNNTINIQKVYNDLKQLTSQEKANEFVSNMSNEIGNFYSRLKRIMDTLLTKYQNKLSQDTLEKLNNINNLCDNWNKEKKQETLIKNNNEINNDQEINLSNFALKLGDKLDEIYFKNNDFSNQTNLQNTQIIQEEISDDDLWIPNELIKQETQNNNLDQELELSFLDAIKQKPTILENKKVDPYIEGVLEIIDKDEDDVFLFNGKEITDEEFLNALKAKL